MTLFFLSYLKPSNSSNSFERNIIGFESFVLKMFARIFDVRKFFDQLYYLARKEENGTRKKKDPGDEFQNDNKPNEQHNTQQSQMGIRLIHT